MSDFFEKDQNQLENTVNQESVDTSADANEIVDEESTVFSAPVEHKQKAPKNAGKKRLISIIASCVAVAVLVGGTLAIIKLIPEMSGEGTVSSIFEDIAVVDADSKTFSSITVNNKNGEFKFVTKEINAANQDGQAQTTTYWTLENVDVSKLSTVSLDDIVSSASSITAMREISTKTPSECGFNNPAIKISVTSSKDSYTVLVGDPSPDKTGTYMMLDGEDKIYLAPDSEFTVFDFTLLDISNKSSIPVTTFNSDTADNKTQDGTYAFFDSLTLSGKSFPETITIVNNKDESDSAALLPYLITTPTNRYANTENLNSLVALFSAEVAVAGNYALDVNDETLKLFGLDNPDVVVTMTIDGEARTFKFSFIDSENCAVVYDGATMIRKVLKQTQAFLQLKPEDLYYKNLFMNSINDIKALKLNDKDGEVKFDISYEEDEDSSKTYFVKANGKDIVAEHFQDFYADFVTTQCTDFTTQEITEKPEGTVTFVFYDDSETVIEFYRINDTEYQYSIDGNAMGKITSSAYQKMVANIKSVAAGEKPV